MSNPRVIEPYGIALSDAQRRAVATAARGNGRLFWSVGGEAGRGTKARWNILQTLESFELSRLIEADRRRRYYEWELTEKGHEVGLHLELPAEQTA